VSNLELLVIVLSAALAGTGIAVFMQGDLGMALMCVGAALKMLSGLGRMPVIDFEKLMNTTSVEDLEAALEQQRDKNDQNKPWLAWISEFSTYLIIGGFFITIVDAL